MNTTPRIFNAMITRMDRDQLIREVGGVIAEARHTVRFDTADQARISGLLKKFEKSPFATPSIKECQNEIGEEIFNALIDSGDLIAVSPDVVFLKKDYEQLIERIRAAITSKGPITLAQVRDMLNTTRKYVQALLEHMDAMGITLREGDFRKLKR